ncbi:MAG: carboxypeptidase-like regulatory domain-containing protein [Flavobacteriaceae bacterium]
MKKVLFTFLVIISQLIYGQKKEITGTVTFKDKPIRGVSVIIKGTQNGIDTNINGKFRLEVNKGDILQFFLIGFSTKEVLIKDQVNLQIILKEEEYLHDDGSYTHYHSIGIGYYGGLINTQKGMSIYYQNKNFFNFGEAYKLKIGYQSGNDSNNQLLIEVSFKDIINNGKKSYNLNFIYNKNYIKSDDFNFSSLVVENEIQVYPIKYRPTIFFGGIGVSKDRNFESKIGYQLGLRQNIYRTLSIYSKTFLWNQFTQLKSGITWFYKNFNFSYEFNTIKNYKEHNISVVYSFIL